MPDNEEDSSEEEPEAIVLFNPEQHIWMSRCREGECGALFIYFESDIMVKEEDGETTYYLECAECGSTNMSANKEQERLEAQYNGEVDFDEDSHLPEFDKMDMIDFEYE